MRRRVKTKTKVAEPGSPTTGQGRRGGEPEILHVEILEAKPNQMFAEAQRQAIRFLRFNRSVPCTECGKRRRVMWTMLCEFYAYDFNTPGFTLVKPDKKHPPLDAVCGAHPLAPAWPSATEEQVDKAFREKAARVYPDKEKRRARKDQRTGK